jgi:hypothetical protein
MNAQSPLRHPSQVAQRRAEAATWGAIPTPDHQPEQKRMRLLSWKPLVKNSLRGFATIQLSIGLKLVDCPVLVTNGKAWAGLPSKPVLDRDGKHAKPDGKPQYSAVVEWKSWDLSERFSQAVVELVRAEHPDDLGGEP